MQITEENTIEAKQVVTHLAIGLLRQDLAIQRGTANPVTILDEQLQWGWDKLALLCLTNGVSPPRHLHQFVDWLHKPIETWETIGQLFDATDLRGALLYFGVPGELCLELSQDMHLLAEPEREIQDGAFKEILAYCQTNYLPDQYTHARRFLVENSYLPHGGIVISANADFEDEIRQWLLRCYEPIPIAAGGP
jgi:hypothetical protein